MYFEPEKERKQTFLRKGKKSSRMGAKFEDDNHAENQKLMKAVSSQTPNSGAGNIKGDEQISGIISIMEELKTAVIPKLSRGSLSFSIKKTWLKKLKEEAVAENKELWYLKFKFLETEDESFVIIGQEELMSMVATLVHDRRKANLADARISYYKAKSEELEAEASLLEARQRTLEKELELCRLQLGQDILPAFEI